MYTIKERIGASKTDGNGRLRLASAVDILQDCSLFWMESEPEFARYLQEQGLGMFLVFRQVDVLRMPAYGEWVSVSTGIYECRGYRGYRNTVVTDSAGKPCILSWGAGAFVDLQTGRSTRLPRQVEQTVTLDPKVEMEYLPGKIKTPQGETETLPPMAVRRGAIDLYGHMNNARYVQEAEELLPPGFKVARLRAAYKRAAGPGAVLYPNRVMGTRGECVLTLSDGRGAPYAVMEFEPGPLGE